MVTKYRKWNNTYLSMGTTIIDVFFHGLNKAKPTDPNARALDS